MNRRLLLLLAVAAGAGLLLVLDGGSEAELVEAVERGAPAPAAIAARAPSAPAGSAGEPAIARLIPRSELIGGEDEGGEGGAMVFGAHNWNPPPPPPPSAQQIAAAAPPPPSAPPLPFTVIGKAVEKGTWEVYLARADKTYIVKQHSVIDGLYRVDAIAPPTLTLTYLPLNQVQTLSIGVLE